MRAALGTERLGSPSATFRGLHIALRRPRKESKAILWGKRTCAKGRPREGLAVGAVTNADIVGIDGGLIGDVAAVTSPVNFHLRQSSASRDRNPPEL
jgi:hypothetical protein